MTRELAILFGERTKAAVLEDGKPAEYLETGADSASSGEILLGKVGRIVPGLNAAFVDIGESRDGFLPLRENSKTFRGEKLTSGSRVLVQVKKEAHGAKGAFLSRDLAICGAHVILMPMNNFTGVSARIREADPETAERLLAVGNRIAPDGMGIVLRTSAPDADEAELAREVSDLLGRWENIRQKATVTAAPAVLTEEDDALASLLNDYLPKGIDRVLTNVPERILRRHPRLKEKTGELDGEVLAERMHTWLMTAGERKVRLPHGGSIVIDACEALTVIDVNTGSDTRGSALERANEEACVEIVRRIRLRNLSGIILIDMIDPKDTEEAERILGLLKNELARDRVKTVVHGITDLGLVEITRKRTGPALTEMTGCTCPRCGGNGWIPVERGERTDE